VPERPVALVTGGARRVGRAIALRLGEAGFDLIVTYRTSNQDANELAQTLEQGGSTARIERLDLDDLDSVESFGEKLAGETRLDALIHNASVYAGTRLDDVTPEAAMRHYRVNALAPLLLTKHLAPLLRRSEMSAGGAIVAMCDIHAMGLPRPGFAPYAMSKAALVEMVRSLARELAPEVRVNGIAPGVIAWPESGPESTSQEQSKYLSRVPLGRSGTPEEAAEMVRWLVQDASYVTGQIIPLDGGRSLR
jgi:pteridine reductase